MANVTVAHVVDMVLEILQDDPDAPEHWTKENLVNWYNLATREVVNLVPEANPVYETIKLAAGVRQTIPASRMGLIDILYNMGTDGLTIGDAITRTDLAMLTAFDRAWTQETDVEAVKNWAPHSMTTFFVYPPSDGTGYIRIKTSGVPTVVTYDEDGDWEIALVGVEEKYVNAVLNWILYRAYQKDTDYPGNIERSGVFLQQFLVSCGATAGASPG